MSNEVLSITPEQAKYCGYIHNAFELKRTIRNNQVIMEKGDIKMFDKIADGAIVGAYASLVHPLVEIEVHDPDLQGVATVFERQTDKAMRKVFRDIVKAEKKLT